MSVRCGDSACHIHELYQGVGNACLGTLTVQVCIASVSDG